MCNMVYRVCAICFSIREPVQMRQIKLGTQKNLMFMVDLMTAPSKRTVRVCVCAYVCVKEHCPVYQTAPVMFMSQQQGIGGVLVSE